MNQQKVQLHVGGIYGDKDSSIERFAKNYNKLSERIRRRLVIENDDHLYSFNECMKIHALTNVPILFDSFPS
jgi:UV DNA damage endonuclease